jgi:hypothetical protein
MSKLPNHSSEIGHMYSSLYLHKVSLFLKAFVGFWFQSQGKGGFEKKDNEYLNDWPICFI